MNLKLLLIFPKEKNFILKFDDLWYKFELMKCLVEPCGWIHDQDNQEFSGKYRSHRTREPGSHSTKLFITREQHSSEVAFALTDPSAQGLILGIHKIIMRIFLSEKNNMMNIARIYKRPSSWYCG